MKENSSRIISEKVIQYIDVDNKDVLEVGCGDGRVTAFLAGKSKRLVAIDPDAEEIQKGKKRNLTGVDFQVGSGEKTQFSDNTFDVVIFTLSLHHQNSRVALEEACRVLKEGGRILVVEPVADGELEQVFALVYNENKEKAEAQRAIKASGLLLERSETFTAKWIFEDKKDLIESIFGYYRVPIHSETAQKMGSHLGEKRNAQPIVLVDLMIIQLLTPAACGFSG